MVTKPQASGQAKFEQGPDVPAVRCVGLAKRFGATVAVREASFEVGRGALMALLGPSGGGKTTLLRMIAGFESPDAGSIEIDGRTRVNGRAPVPPEQRRVGMVFQDYALFPHLSVRDNVAFGAGSGPEREERVASVLGLVGLESAGARMPHQLSGGEQQRVALARALAPAPAVVLLDEPFSNLDASLRARVRDEVRQILRAANTAAVFVTHDQDEAFGLADQVGIILDNTITQIVTHDDVYLHPSSLDVARFLGETNVLDGEASGRSVVCELGTLAIGGGAALDGPVKVAVRPETLRLHPEPGDGPSVAAEVVGREFHGVYKLVTLRLVSGTTLSAVMGLHIPATVGDTVRVGVNSFVSAFPS